MKRLKEQIDQKHHNIEIIQTKPTADVRVRAGAETKMSCVSNKAAIFCKLVTLKTCHLWDLFTELAHRAARLKQVRSLF